jgi:hypothetical protein
MSGYCCGNCNAAMLQMTEVLILVKWLSSVLYLLN